MSEDQHKWVMTQLNPCLSSAVHPTVLSDKTHDGYVYTFIRCKHCGNLVGLQDMWRGVEENTNLPELL